MVKIGSGVSLLILVILLLFDSEQHLFSLTFLSINNIVNLPLLLFSFIDYNWRWWGITLARQGVGGHRSEQVLVEHVMDFH